MMSTSIIVIGSGPVGIQASQLLAEYSNDRDVVVFNGERHLPYNRAKLSEFLYSDESVNKLVFKFDKTLKQKNISIRNATVVDVNLKEKYVVDDNGDKTLYSKLIFATGSKAFRLDIQGNNLKKVYLFRNLDDLIQLKKEKICAENIVIVGGGPLGIETAVALKKKSNTISLIIRGKLLDSGLAKEATAIVTGKLDAAGIDVIHSTNDIKLEGEDSISGVLVDGRGEIKCDVLIFATGAVPNTALAKKIGIRVNRGIVVDDFMQTSAQHVYAIGDCLEYKNTLYNLVAPGFEQANIAVRHIIGQPIKYSGSLPVVRIDMGKFRMQVIGNNMEDNANIKIYRFFNGADIYRQITLREDRIVGATFLGEWEKQAWLYNEIKQRNEIKKKQINNFISEGEVLLGKETINNNDCQTICYCMNVDRQTIKQCINAGGNSLHKVMQTTKAAITCGSCEPAVIQLLQEAGVEQGCVKQTMTLALSFVSIAILFFILISSPMEYSASVFDKWNMDFLWRDNIWKQITGFSLLALVFISALLSLRKRLSKFKLGGLDSWRLLHAGAGTLALVILVIHTGLRLGENLNFLLMMIFTAATMIGSLIGVWMTIYKQIDVLTRRRQRKWWFRFHYTVLWALPALLSMHIVSVYYF